MEPNPRSFIANHKENCCHFALMILPGPIMVLITKNSIDNHRVILMKDLKALSTHHHWVIKVNANSNTLVHLSRVGSSAIIWLLMILREPQNRINTHISLRVTTSSQTIFRVPQSSNIIKSYMTRRAIWARETHQRKRSVR